MRINGRLLGLVLRAKWILFLLPCGRKRYIIDFHANSYKLR